MSEYSLRVCDLCEGVDEHLPACPTGIHKKALMMWQRGRSDALAAQSTSGPRPKPAMGALAEVINLYETYRLGFERGKKMYAGESPL